MIASNDPPLPTPNGRPVDLHFHGNSSIVRRRVLPGPIDHVWAYLTESEKRRKWLAAGPMELRVGGRVELNFRHDELSTQNESTPDRLKSLEGGHTNRGCITRCEPPYLLSFTWDESSEENSEVTFELTPSGSKVILVLTHRRIRDDETKLSVASGWHTHLDILEDRLYGRLSDAFWATHAQYEAEYRKRLDMLNSE